MLRFRVKSPLCGLLLSIVLLCAGAPLAQGNTASQHERVLLAPDWTTGVISNVDRSNFVIADLDNDGTTEVVACGEFNIFALQKQSGPNYGVIWFDSDLTCYRVAAGDRDADGVKELYIGDVDNKVSIVRGDTFALLATLQLPATPNGSLLDIATANVDADPAQELIVVRTDATFVYDATTLALEWRADGKGGRQVAIGNIDGDSTPEIVVNGFERGYVLDAAHRVEKWNRAGGFGNDLALGNLDADAYDELAFIKGCSAIDNTICVLDADTQTIKWSIERVFPAEHCLAETVTIADANDDGVNEVIVGDASLFCSVTGYRGSDHGQLWRIPMTTEDGSYDLAVGDTDDDGQSEVVWVSALTSSAPHKLVIGSAHTQTLEWVSENLSFRLHIAAGDVDADGQAEIVMASSRRIRVYDGLTHEIEWSGQAGDDSFSSISRLALGQLDDDPALEIVVGNLRFYDASLQVFDGLSHSVEWASGVLSSGANSIPAIVLANVDSDASDEIIVGFEDGSVRAYDSVTMGQRWHSGNLGSFVRDLAVGELDGAPGPELAVLTGSKVYVFAVGSWQQKLARDFGGGGAIGVTNSDGAGPGELLLATITENQRMLRAWSGSDYRPLWQLPLYNFVVNQIVSGNLDGDPDQEFVLAGGASFANTLVYTGGLIVGSQITPLAWLEYPGAAKGLRGGIYDVVLADVDQDGQTELITSSPYTFQVVERSAEPFVLYQSHLPVTQRDQ